MSCAIVDWGLSSKLDRPCHFIEFLFLYDLFAHNYVESRFIYYITCLRSGYIHFCSESSSYEEIMMDCALMANPVSTFQSAPSIPNGSRENVCIYR